MVCLVCRCVGGVNGGSGVLGDRGVCRYNLNMNQDLCVQETNA